MTKPKAGAGSWASPAAALLGTSAPALRKAFDGNARKAPDGGTEASVDGVRACQVARVMGGVMAWRLACDIREYVAAMRRAAPGAAGAESELGRELAFALAYADELDPTKREAMATRDGMSSGLPSRSATNDGDASRSLLTTAEAAAYCGFKTPGALRKAHLERRVLPAGRRGGKGTWMWRREDLDAFLCGRRPGEALHDGVDQEAQHVRREGTGDGQAPRVPPVAARGGPRPGRDAHAAGGRAPQGGRGRPSESVEDAIRRIRSIALQAKSRNR